MLDTAFVLARMTRLVSRVQALARQPNVEVTVLDVLRRSGHALPLLMVTVGAGRKRTVLISAGLHGDESAGVDAAVACISRFASDDCALGALVLPCINPYGFCAGIRSNDIGYDLNRTFGQDPAPIEIALVREALGGRHFAFTLDLHEDEDADGFYVYEHTRAGRELGPAMVARVRAAGYPIHSGAAVEGYVMNDGCVVPKEERTSEIVGFFSVYLFDYHTDHSLTTETPTRLPQRSRAAMQELAVDEAIDRFA